MAVRRYGCGGLAMSEAIFGLIGVILGGFLTGGSNYWLRRRDERLKLRAAVRVLVTDVILTRDYLEETILAGAWNRLENDANLDRDLWERHELMLAQHLPDGDWEAVAAAYRHGVIAGPLLRGIIEPNERLERGRILVSSLAQAEEILGRLAERLAPPGGGLRMRLTAWRWRLRHLRTRSTP
jgi:hypothetical protein